MPLFGPPDVDKLKARGDVNGLIKALAYRDESSRSQAAHVRWDAAQSLGHLRDARAVAPLISAMRDQDKTVQTVAVLSLGAIGDLRAVEPLIAAVGDHGHDKDVRIAAVQALGKLGDPRAVEPLITALDHDPHDWVRMMAADALELLGVPGMQGRAQSRMLLAELRAQD